MKRTPYNRERLLFRRQFILGPRFVEGFPTWQRLVVRPTIQLTVHPDLPVCRVERRGRSVTLLGYVLDPHQPWATDADIVSRLLRHVESGETRSNLIRLTYPFGGRWILTIDDGRDQWLFNDPCGYRQVFYTRATAHGVWCASQPGLLAEALHLSVDQEGLASFELTGEGNRSIGGRATPRCTRKCATCCQIITLIYRPVRLTGSGQITSLRHGRSREWSRRMPSC